MISRVSSTNKEKQAKRRNRAKKQTLNRIIIIIKTEHKETEKAASPGVEPGSSADARNSLTTAPHCHTRFEKLIWLNQNHFPLS